MKLKPKHSGKGSASTAERTLNDLSIMPILCGLDIGSRRRSLIDDRYGIVTEIGNGIGSDVTAKARCTTSGRMEDASVFSAESLGGIRNGTGNRSGRSSGQSFGALALICKLCHSFSLLNAALFGKYRAKLNRSSFGKCNDLLNFGVYAFRGSCAYMFATGKSCSKLTNLRKKGFNVRI